MKKHLVLCILCTLCCVAYAQKIKIKTGIVVLKEQNFKCLEGKRVGLITNPTGVDNHMKSTIDILHEAPNVNLVALFGPEHGVRGDVHGAHAGRHAGLRAAQRRRLPARRALQIVRTARSTA